MKTVHGTSTKPLPEHTGEKTTQPFTGCGEQRSRNALGDPLTCLKHSSAASVCVNVRLVETSCLSLAAESFPKILELNSQRHLACAIASVFRCLHAGDFPEGRRGHIRRRRSVVQMIRQVRECALHLHAKLFPTCEGFGNSSRDCHCARTNQTADPAVSHRTGRHWIERAQIEILVWRGIRKIAVAHAVRPLKSSPIHKIQVPWVIAGARNGREIGPRLPQADRTDRPASKNCLGNRTHVAEKTSPIPHGKLVDGRHKHPLPAHRRDVPAIRRQIEAVRYRSSVDYFGRESRRCVATHIAQTLGPHVTGLQSKTGAAAVV